MRDAIADAAVAAAVEAAAEGVAVDGLVIDRDADGYVLEVRAPDGVSGVTDTVTDAVTRTGLSESHFRDALEDHEDHVANWYYWSETVAGEGTARRAFLRWCERAPLEGVAAPGDGDADTDADANAATDGPSADGAESAETGAETAEPIRSVPGRHDALQDGVSRTWGQLLITAELADASTGERVYHLRHVDDEDEAAADLERFDDPRAAREIATDDERDRYRPLKTAPTLVSGWRFAALSGRELVAAIDFFYPATIANWYRERRGELDVDHWLETAERQTGIYDLIEDLPREAVEWMTEACCVDSQCLRRREWDYEAGDEIAVDGGDGEFPCREPCSLVIAAARQWTILESERERTWTLELTTGEKNQLEELIDAVADGRIDEIREADLADGANRYRARYLRAKRFDDEGSLEATAEERDE